ncbi:MAG: 2-oxoglutarate dehydrogenase complex dihydrolipoyllysine-residue succinyltransferase [Pseudomonadota bacterium]
MDIVVPTLGESVTEATIAQWLKKPGDAVALDEPLVELETDKVTVEVNAAQAGVLEEIVANEGDEVEVGALIGKLGEGSGAPAASEKPAQEKKTETEKAATEADKAPAKRPEQKPASTGNGAAKTATANLDYPLAPAVRKLVEENNLDAAKIPASGKNGRLTKGDVLAFMEGGGSSARPAAKAPTSSGPRPREDREERVRMTRLRQRIAERLKDAQNTAAMLTTFNEVDMTNMMAARAEYKEAFEKKFGVRLGFMSFFVKAAVVALKEFPAVNAEIDGDDIVYKDYYDIGVAVSTPNGLVVPVVRDCDEKNFADIEASINDMGKRARDGKLGLDEMSGGTFSITNGGVFGSLMSTPILNPPQSAILGMHAIKQRPMVVDGEIKARPMMYLALSYDHRIIDGREAVSFLVRLKDCIEDPRRVLLEL